MSAKIKYFFGGLILTTILVWSFVFVRADSGYVKVDFLDVGQGDAILISAGSNQVLIDGGPSGVILEKLGKAMPFYDKTIELVIATHPDADHISGLVDVLKRYNVERVLTTGIVSETQTAKLLDKLISEKNVQKTVAHFGQRVKIYPGVNLDILYPFSDLSGQKFENENNTSVVAKLNVGSESILLTGDAETPVEWQLLNAGINLNSDILKVAHHGSKSSTSEEFVKAISPEMSVIQVGAKNTYGHPTDQTLERLKGSKIFRTDLDGDIEAIFDGQKFNFLTHSLQ